ncbi:MAG: Uma2 family endonuclease [Acidobacteria bacterium]|nr:Uma2 family endonuclease [Acidobacteriota bacterium]
MSKRYQTFLYEALEDGIYYPDSDGEPMAENTTQYNWIVMLKEGLEAERPNDFIAADLFWYPVQGDPTIRYAPDVMVALGRPKGERPSYKQWREENVAPQIVFEILSPGNRRAEMKDKFKFYEKYQVEEYYVYNPDKNKLEIWERDTIDNTLKTVNFVGGWTSPRLGIRFQLSSNKMQIFHTDGSTFLTVQELRDSLKQMVIEKEKERAEKEKERIEKEKERAEKEKERAEKESIILIAEKERTEKERLKEKLRLLGIDPDTI